MIFYLLKKLWIYVIYVAQFTKLQIKKLETVLALGLSVIYMRIKIYNTSTHGDETFKSKFIIFQHMEMKRSKVSFVTHGILRSIV